MKEILVLVASVSFPAALAAQPVAGGPATPQRQIKFAVNAIPLGKTLPGLREESFTISPEGKRIAYVVGVGDKAPPGPLPAPLHLPLAVVPGKVQVVVDGVAGPVFKGEATVPVFSRDGQHVAYAAMGGLARRPITIAMVDGAESQPCRRSKLCNAIGRPVFSPDGRHLAYVAQRKKLMSWFYEWRMVLDDAEGRDYEWIADPAFTPDSQRLAYFAWTEKNDKKAVLVNGSEVTPLRPDATGYPVFSADAKRIAFVAKRPDGFVAVLDGQEGPVFDRIGRLAFRPDGHLTYAARRGQKAFTVIDGSDPQEHPQYSHVGEPVLSPDGQHTAYWAFDGTHETVVVDGVAGKAYDAIGTLVFSPDSRHLAVEARLGPQWRLVVDGVEGPEYTPPRGFPVDRDSRHLLHRNPWVFERADLLTYVGVRDGEMTRWEVRITEAPPPLIVVVLGQAEQMGPRPWW